MVFSTEITFLSPVIHLGRKIAVPLNLKRSYANGEKDCLEGNVDVLCAQLQDNLLCSLFLCKFS